MTPISCQVTEVFEAIHLVIVSVHYFLASTMYSYSFFMTGWVNRFANAGDTAMEVAGNTALRVSYDFKILFLCVALHYFLQLSHWNLDFLVLF
jgi:hypothetical protein